MDLQIVLQYLSYSAIVTTIALFFCGIPICLTIKRRLSTKDISGVPFLMGLLGASFWLRYGLLKGDNTMITVNVVGASFFLIYCLFYLYFAKPKTAFAIKLSAVILSIAAMVIWIAYRPDLDYLGILCMTFNIINFGAPLAGLGVVLKQRNCSTLPLPLCIANFLVSSQWFLYGNLVHDPYIMAPNGIGMALAIIQLLLFIVFPMKEGDRSPLERLAAWFTGRQFDDLEKGSKDEKPSGSPSNYHPTSIKKDKAVEASVVIPPPPQFTNSTETHQDESRADSFGASSNPPSYRSRAGSVHDPVKVLDV
ncbi:unnamed protein product [Caenorhabditis auriculariae]|uniref:Sugar transporter SWEET n=1 Tax=Caenorhabditis auriculariae TaxID=2777116 RepID=A0A8S1HWZ0_9PELO|nr:unnamed protein product [Caenorhabditis auriculariae]